MKLLQQKPQQCSATKTVEFVYFLLVTFETDDNYSIRNEKTLFAHK